MQLSSLLFKTAFLSHTLPDMCPAALLTLNSGNQRRLKKNSVKVLQKTNEQISIGLTDGGIELFQEEVSSLPSQPSHHICCHCMDDQELVPRSDQKELCHSWQKNFKHRHYFHSPYHQQCLLWQQQLLCLSHKPSL